MIPHLSKRATSPKRQRSCSSTCHGDEAMSIREQLVVSIHQDQDEGKANLRPAESNPFSSYKWQMCSLTHLMCIYLLLNDAPKKIVPKKKIVSTHSPFTIQKNTPFCFSPVPQQTYFARCATSQTRMPPSPH